MNKLFFILSFFIVACAKQELSTDSKMIITLNKVGQAAERAKRYEYAVSVYKEAHKLEPNNIEVIEHLATNLSLLHQYHQVSSICQIGLTVDPDNIRLIEILGSSLIAQARFSNAIYWVSRDLQLSKGKSVIGLNSLGLILDSLSYHSKAQGCYKKSLALNSQNQQTLNNYGLSLALSNNVGEAMDYLLAANALTDSKISLANIALVQKLRKKHKKISKYLRKQLFPKPMHLSKKYTKDVFSTHSFYCK